MNSTILTPNLSVSTAGWSNADLLLVNLDAVNFDAETTSCLALRVINGLSIFNVIAKQMHSKHEDQTS